MTLGEYRTRLKISIKDLTNQYTITDAELDTVLRTSIFDTVKLLVESQHDYFKKVMDFSVSGGTILAITLVDTPISEYILKLTGAMFKQTGTNTLFNIGISDVETVFQDGINAHANGSIGFSKEKLWFHLPTGVTDGTLSVIYYTGSYKAELDTEEIEMPADYATYVINTVKKQLYMSFNYTIPRWLEHELYKVECSLKALHVDSTITFPNQVLIYRSWW